MISFQTATVQECAQLADLVNSAYRGESSKKGWTTEADLLGGQRTDAESLREIIQAPMNQIEIAFDGGKIVGSVHLVHEESDTLYFGMLTVAPHIQAKGLGKIILNHVEDVARRYDLKRLRMTVIPSRAELIAFYERRGFKATGKYEPFPEADPRFGLPKVANLSLKEFEKRLLPFI
jgi:GNAT superfamily N-acetyltransferase